MSLVSPTEAKKQAKILGRQLRPLLNTPLSHGQTLDIIARLYGAANWNTFCGNKWDQSSNRLSELVDPIVWLLVSEEANPSLVTRLVYGRKIEERFLKTQDVLRLVHDAIACGKERMLAELFDDLVATSIRSVPENLSDANRLRLRLELLTALLMQPQLESNLSTCVRPSDDRRCHEELMTLWQGILPWIIECVEYSRLRLDGSFVTSPSSGEGLVDQEFVLRLKNGNGEPYYRGKVVLTWTDINCQMLELSPQLIPKPKRKGRVSVMSLWRDWEISDTQFPIEVPDLLRNHCCLRHATKLQARFLNKLQRHLGAVAHYLESQKVAQ